MTPNQKALYITYSVSLMKNSHDEYFPIDNELRISIYKVIILNLRQKDITGYYSDVYWDEVLRLLLKQQPCNPKSSNKEN